MREKNVNDGMPFEKALEKLESIVARMEEGELTLDEMVKYYEEGNRLSKLCSTRLKSFEKKIEILSRDDGKGGQWQEFDPESGKRVSTATINTDADSQECGEDNNEDSLF